MTETEALDLDLEDFEFSDENDSKNESNNSKELSSLAFSTQQLMETQKPETEKYTELLETDSDNSVEQLELIEFSEHNKETQSFPTENRKFTDTQSLINTQAIPQMIDLTDTEIVPEEIVSESQNSESDAELEPFNLPETQLLLEPVDIQKMHNLSITEDDEIPKLVNFSDSDNDDFMETQKSDYKPTNNCPPSKRHKMDSDSEFENDEFTFAVTQKSSMDKNSKNFSLNESTCSSDFGPPGYFSNSKKTINEIGTEDLVFPKKFRNSDLKSQVRFSSDTKTQNRVSFNLTETEFEFAETQKSTKTSFEISDHDESILSFSDKGTAETDQKRVSFNETELEFPETQKSSIKSVSFSEKSRKSVSFTQNSFKESTDTSFHDKSIECSQFFPETQKSKNLDESELSFSGFEPTQKSKTSFNDISEAEVSGIEVSGTEKIDLSCDFGPTQKSSKSPDSDEDIFAPTQKSCLTEENHEDFSEPPGFSDSESEHSAQQIDFAETQKSVNYNEDSEKVENSVESSESDTYERCVEKPTEVSTELEKAESQEISHFESTTPNIPDPKPKTIKNTITETQSEYIDLLSTQDFTSIIKITPKQTKKPNKPRITKPTAEIIKMPNKKANFSNNLLKLATHNQIKSSTPNIDQKTTKSPDRKNNKSQFEITTPVKRNDVDFDVENDKENEELPVAQISTQDASNNDSNNDDTLPKTRFTPNIGRDSLRKRKSVVYYGTANTSKSATPKASGRRKSRK